MFKQSVKSQYILLGKGLLFLQRACKIFFGMKSEAEFWYGRDMPSLNPGRIKIKKVSNSSTVFNVTSDFQTLLMLGEVNHRGSVEHISRT